MEKTINLHKKSKQYTYNECRYIYNTNTQYVLVGFCCVVLLVMAFQMEAFLMLLRRIDYADF